MDFYCVCTPRIDPKKCPNTYERVQCTSSKRIGNEPIPEGENFHPRGWKNAPMITFYHLFESIYGLSGSIDKGLTSQGRGREEGRGGDENCCDRTTPVFNDRSNSFHYRTRHFGRRIPSRLMPPRPTISRPWNGKKGGEGGRGGGGKKKKEKREKRKKM